MFIFCDSTGGYSVVCLFHPPGYLLSPFFVLLLVFLCRSVFALLSSVAPVSFAYFPAPGFLFIIVRCLSGCCITILSFSRHCPVLSCLLLFLFFLCLWLWCICLLSSHCSPSFAAVAVPCGSSGFPVSLACSVLHPHSLGISFIVFMFLPPLLTCGASLRGVEVSVFAGQLLRRSFCRRSLSSLALDLALRLRMLLSCLLCFPSGFLTWLLLGLSHSSCSLVLSCCSIVFLLCFGTMFAIFSFLSFQLLLGCVLRLLDFSWGLSILFEFRFFS